MSQYPPPPGQPQQPMPPMQPIPPGTPGAPAPGYTVPPSSRTSGMAVASLICGILGCIPVITGLLAVLFGFIGIGQTSKPNVRGRGLAIVGLLLGLISIIVWSAIGWGSYKAYALMKGVHGEAKQFVQDLASGNVDAAATRADPQALPAEKLKQLHDHMTHWGALQDVTMLPGKIDVNDQGGDAVVVGTATFKGGAEPVMLHMKKYGNDWKVTEVELGPNASSAATQPAGGSE